MEYYSAIEKMKAFNNVDRPWGYYAKCKKSDGERKIPYDFTHTWTLKTNKWAKQINKTNRKRR